LKFKQIADHYWPLLGLGRSRKSRQGLIGLTVIDNFREGAVKWQKEVEATMIITLKKMPVKDENGKVVDHQLRVVVDTDGSRHDRGIDIDVGYPQGGKNIQECVLGQVARFDWERPLKKLFGV